jgi:hypothetical protein
MDPIDRLWNRGRAEYIGRYVGGYCAIAVAGIFVLIMHFTDDVLGSHRGIVLVIGVICTFTTFIKVWGWVATRLNNHWTNETEERDRQAREAEWRHRRDWERRNP